MLNVVVMGLGFVGLTTAVGLADMGHHVYGLDVDEERFGTIASGCLPFLEPGLDAALADNLNKRFFPTDDLVSAISDSDIVFYCVGTPYGENGEADLTYLYAAIEQTLKAVHDDKYRVLVVKSTIPPSTTKEKIIPFLEKKGVVVGRQLGVANNPEFLREGYCWEDFVNADRIVLGVEDERSEEMLCSLYRDVKCPIHCVSFNTGEFIKYLSNTMLATFISYANEMSIIADAIGGIDIAKSFRILHQDKRWGDCNMKSYVYPGCGYGGYCLPKDTNAFYALAKSIGQDPHILRDVIETNESMPGYIAEKIGRAANGDLNAKIGILGLSFKPESDDVRDSASAKVIARLNDMGYRNIWAYDPVAGEEFINTYGGLVLALKATCEELVETADLLVILTAWNEFKNLDKITDKKIVDCRYVL